MPYEDEADENDKSLDDEIKEIMTGQEIDPVGVVSVADGEDIIEENEDGTEESVEENAQAEEV